MTFFFDKVTTGTYSFVSVISNVNVTGATIAGLELHQLKHNFLTKLKSIQLHN